MSETVRFAAKLAHESKWTFRTVPTAELLDAAMCDGRTGEFVYVKERYYVFYGYGADSAYTAVAVIDRDQDFEDVTQKDLDSFLSASRI